MRSAFVLAFLLCSLAGAARAEYIRSWLICGPFGGDLETEYMKNEGELEPRPGPTPQGKSWRAYSSFNNTILLGKNAFPGGEEEGCVYAAVTVYSESSYTGARMFLGTSGGVKVWLNGKLILVRDGERKFAADQDKLHVSLRAGSNRLLVKVNSGERGRTFSCKITDWGGKDIPGLAFSPEQENLYRIPVGRIFYSSVDRNDTVMFSPINLIDGDKATVWASAHSDNQWITFRLKDDARLARVLLKWDTETYARSYVIQTSNDGANWRIAYRNGNCEGGEEDIILGSPVSCSYVRLHFLERGTPNGIGLSEVYLFGLSRTVRAAKETKESVQSIPVVEDKDSLPRRLWITAYPTIVSPGKKVSVDLSWKDAPSAEKYRLVVQIEKLDFLPPVSGETAIEIPSQSGRRTITFTIPDDLPRFDGYRFVAAFLSKDHGWKDMYDVTSTPKNVKVDE